MTLWFDDEQQTQVEAGALGVALFSLVLLWCTHAPIVVRTARTSPTPHIKGHPTGHSNPPRCTHELLSAARTQARETHDSSRDGVAGVSGVRIAFFASTWLCAALDMPRYSPPARRATHRNLIYWGPG